jgi:hypothetical protein
MKFNLRALPHQHENCILIFLEFFTKLHEQKKGEVKQQLRGVEATEVLGNPIAKCFTAANYCAF